MLTSLARRPHVLVLAGSLLFIVPLTASRVIDSPADEREVRVINTPDVRLTEINPSVLQDLRRAQRTPSFLRSKKRYAIAWNRGEAPQSYVVVAVGDDGWIGTIVSDTVQPELVVVIDPREILWINVTHAFSIQEVIP